MTRQANGIELKTIEAIERHLAGIRNQMKAMAECDGVKDAIALVDQLEEAVADIAADIEMELHERRDPKGR